MKTLNRSNAGTVENRPVKVLQFGTGNFLRGFTDWIVDLMNEKTRFNGAVHLVQVHGKRAATDFDKQDGLYHVLTRGIKNGKTVDESRLITCVSGVTNPYLDYAAFLQLGKNPDLEWIVSNTTEAGIYVDQEDVNPHNTPQSFPGKLTALLFSRFQAGGKLLEKSLHVLPCELIEDNGQMLRKCVEEYAQKWKLPEGFTDWHKEFVHYYDTLVDRIVPGFPQAEAQQLASKLGYDDKLMVVTEPFHFWAIAGPESLNDLFPAKSIGLGVHFVENLAPYRTRKVRILNGGHTVMVPLAYLRGLRIVKDAVEDPIMGKFLKDSLFEEIIPSMDLNEEDLKQFAEDVFDRFRNPFIRHQLSAIALNSISKFRVRVLPSLVAYIRKQNKLPANIVQSFAALIVFYRGHFKGESLPVNDTKEVTDFFLAAWKSEDAYEIVPETLANTSFWGQDLNQYPGLSDAIIYEVKQLLDEEKVKIG